MVVLPIRGSGRVGVGPLEGQRRGWHEAWSHERKRNLAGRSPHTVQRIVERPAWLTHLPTPAAKENRATVPRASTEIRLGAPSERGQRWRDGAARPAPRRGGHFFPFSPLPFFTVHHTHTHHTHTHSRWDRTQSPVAPLNGAVEAVCRGPLGPWRSELTFL